MAVQSETEHVAEWIVLAGSAACVVEFKMDRPQSGLSQEWIVLVGSTGV